MCHHDNMYVKVAYDSFNSKRRYDDDDDYDRKACNQKKVHHEHAGNSRRPNEETCFLML